MRERNLALAEQMIARWGGLPQASYQHRSPARAGSYNNNPVLII
jgi:hypothetical protein